MIIKVVIATDQGYYEKWPDPEGNGIPRAKRRVIFDIRNSTNLSGVEHENGCQAEKNNKRGEYVEAECGDYRPFHAPHSIDP